MNDSPDPDRAARHQRWLVQIDAAVRRSDMPVAETLSKTAIADGLEHPALLNIVASGHYHQGRPQEALPLLRRATALDPGDVHVLNALGLCLAALGQGAEALEALGGANRADPGYSPAWYNKGVVLEELLDFAAAERCYEQALKLDPTYVEPIERLGWLTAERGDAGQARVHAERALALAPGRVLPRLTLALTDELDGRHEAAEARLAPLTVDTRLGPVDRALAWGLLGDARDAQDRPAEAFAAYAACKDELRRCYASRFSRPDVVQPLAQAQRLLADLEAAPPWTSVPSAATGPDDPSAHVFLIGFPRSGTTLLENILAAHPDVVSLEEKDCLGPSIATFLTSTAGMERLARLGEAEAAEHRRAYWRAVRGFGVHPAGRVFIDKLPLHTVNLPLIARLFPAARILLARRDPRDVVLSCFRRRFGMNASMYQLVTLQGAAAYYDAVMRLAEACRRLLSLDLRVVRYEDLVADFEGQARGVCDFLGLDWADSLHDFAAAARARDIATPSAVQVARGLNRDGLDQWRRYRDQLAPVLPLLQPWVDRFGYPAA